MDPVDLTRYNHRVRRLYLHALSKLTWDELVESHGASFDSLRNIFLHSVIAEYRFFNFTIPGKMSEWVDIPFDDFKDINSLIAFVDDVNAKTEAYISKLEVEDLKREIPMPWRKTPPTKAPIDVLLTARVFEDIYHYGELEAILWQKDHEAPCLSFIEYWAQKT